MTLPLIERVSVYAILHSGGGPAAEAVVGLNGGASGRASAPVAIEAGYRERPRTASMGVGSEIVGEAASCLRLILGSAMESQGDLDEFLTQNMSVLGADVSLAVSLAYARAAAASLGAPLTRYFASLCATSLAMPQIMAAIISGGLHDGYRSIPFQQLMVVPGTADISQAIAVVLAVYDEAERRLREHGWLAGYSASSGMLTTLTETSPALELITDILDDLGLTGKASLAVDVAAEHLVEDGQMRLASNLVQPTTVLSMLVRLARDFPVAVLEDPFAPADEDLWRQLRSETGNRTAVLGDDLFATTAQLLDPSLADGVILKMNQVGTVSGTVDTVKRAAVLGMKTCASHRSHETEDTFVCDLAVGVSADWIKIGGPRRGERVAKYNALLRLADAHGV